MTFPIKQRQQLRGQAHKLKPVVIIGNHGLTESVQNEIDQSLLHHELIKIRLNAATKKERQLLLQSICEHQGAEYIQLIGNIGTIYRMKKTD